MLGIKGAQQQDLELRRKGRRRDHGPPMVKASEALQHGKAYRMACLASILEQDPHRS